MSKSKKTTKKEEKKTPASTKKEKTVKVAAQTEEQKTTEVEDKNKDIPEAEVIEEVKNPEPEPQPESTPKPKSEEKPAEKKPKSEKPKAEKKPKVETPEVEEVKNPEEETGPSLGQRLRALKNGDRIDANHTVDLMGLVHKQYISNPDAPTELKATMSKQFDVMAFLTLAQYNAQVEDDFQTLGIQVSKEQFAQIENVARTCLGIPMKALPGKDPKQLLIDFSGSLPKDVKAEAKKDAEVVNRPIPEPDPNLPEKDKLDVLRAIYNRKNDGGVGANLLNAIEWGRKAFAYKDDMSDPAVLGNLLKKEEGGTMIHCLRGMITGRLNNEHSILGAHCLLKKWIPKCTDAQVSDLMKVLASYTIENRYNTFHENAKNAGRYFATEGIESEFAFVNKEIAAGNDPAVIKAILEGKETCKIDDYDINCAAIKKSLIATYGDSDSILKDKLNEIVKYYAEPIPQFSKMSIFVN